MKLDLLPAQEELQTIRRTIDSLLCGNLKFVPPIQPALDYVFLKSSSGNDSNQILQTIFTEMEKFLNDIHHQFQILKQITSKSASDQNQLIQFLLLPFE
jgi:hypothetical protein